MNNVLLTHTHDTDWPTQRSFDGLVTYRYTCLLKHLCRVLSVIRLRRILIPSAYFLNVVDALSSVATRLRDVEPDSRCDFHVQGQTDRAGCGAISKLPELAVEGIGQSYEGTPQHRHHRHDSDHRRRFYPAKGGLKLFFNLPPPWSSRACQIEVFETAVKKRIKKWFAVIFSKEIVIICRRKESYDHQTVQTVPCYQGPLVTT